MPDEPLAQLRTEMISCSLWLRELLVDQAGEDVAFDSLLGRAPGDHPPYAENIFELDRLRLLKSIMDNLRELLGSEGAAIEWLFHDERFLHAVGSAPFDHLEGGEFNALALLHAFTQVETSHRRNAVRGDGSVPPFVEIFSRQSLRPSGITPGQNSRIAPGRGARERGSAEKGGSNA